MPIHLPERSAWLFEAQHQLPLLPHEALHASLPYAKIFILKMVIHSLDWLSVYLECVSRQCSFLDRIK
jgi:hypothetical protein